jgi:chromosome segregation ATPase
MHQLVGTASNTRLRVELGNWTCLKKTTGSNPCRGFAPSIGPVGRGRTACSPSKLPVTAHARDGDGNGNGDGATSMATAPTALPALALSCLLQVGALGAVEPAIAANLAAQGRGTAAELQSLLEQRGAKLPALTSSPNERKVDIEAKSGSSRELIRELRRQNQEIQDLKAELQGTDPKRKRSSGVAAPGVTASSVAPAAPTAGRGERGGEGDGEGASASASSSSSSGTLPVLNILGIFAAAGLGGYVTLQKKDAEEAEAAYKGKLNAEQGIVSGLKDDLSSIKGLLDEEKELVEKIKRESATASSEYARQLGLEKSSKEAVEREKRLVEQSLSSEQRLAEALRLEAEKTSELLEAEKAAKFAADAEASQLKGQLADVQKALAEEKLQVQKWQSDNEEANKRLSEAREENEGLSEDLEEGARRIAALNAAAAALQDQIANATAVNASQSQLIARIGKEALTMSEAMSVMRSQAAERALAAAAERDRVTQEREKFEAEALANRSQIAEQQDKIRSLEGEIDASKAAIQRANTELAATKQELAKAQESMASMQTEINSLNDKIASATSALESEQGDNANLRSELAALRSELTNINSSFEAERQEKDQLLQAIDQLKDEYNAMTERVESGEDTVQRLRKEAGELKKTISDLETKNRTLGSNLIQVEEQSRAKLADVESRLAAAEKNSGGALASRDDAFLAINKLESVIKVLQDDMADSSAMALQASAELENERHLRSQAEEELFGLREELASITAAEAAARDAVIDEVASLKAEYEHAMEKLKELAAARAAAPKRAAKPKVELTEEEKAEKKRIAAVRTVSC